MNALQRYERLRGQLTDVADLLDADGHDVLAAAALETAEGMRVALDEAGVRSYREWYARRDARWETDAREESGR